MTISHKVRYSLIIFTYVITSAFHYLKSKYHANVIRCNICMCICSTYTYFIFSDYTLTEQDDCAHCIILDSKEDEILVRIDDISIKKRYLTCLLNEDRLLDDEISTLTNSTIVF
jgi:hypothetical protein